MQVRFVILGVLIALSLFVFGCASQQPSAPVCGNAQLEAGEQCESNSPCSGSSLICSQCQCVKQQVQKKAAAVCGNGKLEAGELCEKGIACPQGGVCDEKECSCSYGGVAGGNAANATNQTQSGGANATNQTQPPGAVPFCGDGKIAEGEECDVGTAAAPGNNKCPSGEYCSSCKCYTQAEPISCRSNHEYYQATGINEFKQSPFLACGDDCSYLGVDYKCDLQTCTCILKTVTSHTCGNGIKETVEECDGADANWCNSSQRCSNQCTCVAK